MKIVISCSGSKNGEKLNYSGKEITFVAVPSSKEHNQYRPDDIIPNEQRTWREYINEQENEDLLKSYELYKPPIYQALYAKYGIDLYILSAGWGLINSEFKIPKYDITFSKSAEKNLQRKKEDAYNDYNHLKGIDPNERIIFLGGSDYLQLFYRLSSDLQNEKIIFYKKKNINTEYPFLKKDSTYKLIKYETKRSTNWHYGCAEELIYGKVKL